MSGYMDEESLQAGLPPSFPPSLPDLAIAQVAVVIEGGVEVEVKYPLRAVPVEVHNLFFLRGRGVLLERGGEGGREWRHQRQVKKGAKQHSFESMKGKKGRKDRGGMESYHGEGHLVLSHDLLVMGPAVVVPVRADKHAVEHAW